MCIKMVFTLSCAPALNLTLNLSGFPSSRFRASFGSVCVFGNALVCALNLNKLKPSNFPAVQSPFEFKLQKIKFLHSSFPFDSCNSNGHLSCSAFQFGSSAIRRNFHLIFAGCSSSLALKLKGNQFGLLRTAEDHRSIVLAASTVRRHEHHPDRAALLS